ncbi:MAG: SDR family NAD(P)-dependent oxidoreductase [Candidatus Micrarchaeota archaeon]
MKILVTGGAGFIGSSTVDALLKEGYDVRALDNFEPYYSPEQKRKNLENARKNKNFELIEGDITNLEIVKKAVSGVDAIIHQAAQAGVRASVDNPAKTNRINIDGTLNVLTCAKDAGIKKIVFASSSSVYGKVKYLPFDELHPTNPVSPYGVSKLACEHYCRVFSELYGLEIPMLRYFTVYGPRMRPDLAINIFMHKMIKNESITLFGDGLKSRDFTYIDDVVSATILALEKGKTDTFNVGGGNYCIMNELIEKLMQITNSKSKIIKIENAKGDAEHTKADNKKAKDILGWKPKAKLEEGLKIYYEWILKNE